MISLPLPRLALVLLTLTFGAGAFISAPLAQDIDFDVIFNCSADGPIGAQTPEKCLETRASLLENCTACHTFVPIVKAEKSPEGWDGTLGVHRSRVQALTDAQFEDLREFVKAHFNDQLPPPQLPPELEALGSGMPA